MNTYWSTYVQTTEELYGSRALRFREDNSQTWLNMMGAVDGMRILEVGCGGGLFCHRVKVALPDAHVTGLDLDDGHVAYAARKAAELDLDCTFVAGDACQLPFSAETFDLAFSHTVMCFCDPDRFSSEQYRVLSAGGHMVAMDVINRGNSAEQWLPPNDTEEQRLFDRLWAAACLNDLSQIKRQSDSKRQWAESMRTAGFVDISFRTLATISYCPDSADVDDERALDQISQDRLSTLSSCEKARRMAPEALSTAAYQRLTDLINHRYDERVALYQRSERLWDYNTSTVLAVVGAKPFY